MVAVYYNCDSSPFTIYTIKVESEDISDFLNKVEKLGYPLPSKDIVFIENDEIINQLEI